MPGYRYGALLTPFSLNLLVTDVKRAVDFYQYVLQAEVHYHDVDFGALRVGSIEVMLHADHTHEEHAWYPVMTGGAVRGIGAQMRLLGVDPDETARRAEEVGAQVIAPPMDKGHGWREVLVRDPEGYEWAVGVLIPPAKGPFGPVEG
ncbi:MAG: hypothetical protein OHK0046_26450 [Anaerolineae bacterium]